MPTFFNAHAYFPRFVCKLGNNAGEERGNTHETQGSTVFRGAAGYSTLEILVREHTHWTMAVLSGLCLCALCFVAHIFSQKAFCFRPRWARLSSPARNF